MEHYLTKVTNCLSKDKSDFPNVLQLLYETLEDFKTVNFEYEFERKSPLRSDYYVFMTLIKDTQKPLNCLNQLMLSNTSCSMEIFPLMILFKMSVNSIKEFFSQNAAIDVFVSKNQKRA